KPPADAKGALMDLATANQALIETIVETDENALARYFEGTQPTLEEAEDLVVRAVVTGTLIPIVCVASKASNSGLKELLDILAHCAPSPDKLIHKATNEKG